MYIVLRSLNKNKRKEKQNHKNLSSNGLEINSKYPRRDNNFEKKQNIQKKITMQ